MMPVRIAKHLPRNGVLCREKVVAIKRIVAIKKGAYRVGKNFAEIRFIGEGKLGGYALHDRVLGGYCSEGLAHVVSVARVQNLFPPADLRVIKKTTSYEFPKFRPQRP